MLLRSRTSFKGARRAGSISFLSEANDTTSRTVYTFNVGFGDAAQNRYIIVGAVVRKSGTSGTINTVSIGGVAADIVAIQTNTRASNNFTLVFAAANVPSGASGDVVVTASTEYRRCGIGVWRATGIAATPADTVSTGTENDLTLSGDVTLAGAGFAVAAGAIAGSTTATWSGAGEDYDVNFQAFTSHSGAHQPFAAAVTDHNIQVTFSSSVSVTLMVAAAWEYAS